MTNRIGKALAIGLSAGLIYAGGGKLVEYIQGGFSEQYDHPKQVDKKKSVFELPHYTAAGNILEISEADGAYHISVQIQSEGTEPDALSALDCVSTCKRTLLVNPKSINDPYREDLERLIKSELPKGDGVVKTIGTFYVTNVKQGNTYMAAVQALSVLTTEARLQYHGTTGTGHEAPPQPSSSSEPPSENFFDKIKPYVPIIMKYVDLEDMVKVNEIIENFKDGALDGVLELSRRVNWKKYHEDKQPTELETLIKEMRSLVAAGYEGRNDAQTNNDGVKTVKTEDVLGILVGGRSYGGVVKLRVKLEDHPELQQDKDGTVILEVNHTTKRSADDQVLLRAFLGKYNWQGCRKNPCGEYGFNGEILPSPTPQKDGVKYVLHRFELANEGMKGEDDMVKDPTPEPRQWEEPAAKRKEDNHRIEMPGLFTILGRGIRSTF